MPPRGRGMHVLIVGAGMYVCGRGTDGFGTILPAVFQAKKNGLVEAVYVASRSAESASFAARQAEKLKAVLDVEVKVNFYPAQGSDEESYLRALDDISGPCCAIVSVPDSLHCQVASSLMARGIHVQVVKPLVPTVDDARRLIQERDRAGVLATVEYHKRFDEANLKLLELIESGALGRLLNFVINYSQRKVIPTAAFSSWVHETDIFQYLGVHYVDLILFLTGARPVRLLSWGQRQYLADTGLETYDTIHTLIEWEGNGHSFLSSHLTGWIDPNTTTAMSDQRIEVIGTEGRYWSDQRDRGVTWVRDGRCPEEVNPYFTQIYRDFTGQGRMAWGYGPRSILQFIAASAAVEMAGKEPSSVMGIMASLEDSLVIAAVLEASRQSLRNRSEWIAVNW